MKVPFGSLLGVSESSPVAGAIQGSNPCLNLRCRTRTRVAEMRPASHTNALGSLFIPSHREKRKEIFDFSQKSLPEWYAGHEANSPVKGLVHESPECQPWAEMASVHDDFSGT